MKISVIKIRNGVIAAFLVISNLAFGQRPFVSGLDKTKGTVSEVVNISGLNFSTTAASNIVYFGAARATVTSATANLLTVTVPAGATYGPVKVTVNGLTAFSSQHFLLSYDGTTFSNANLRTQQQFPSAALEKKIEPFDLTVADFDGDGLVDIIKTNDGATTADIYRNISDATAINFAPPTDLTTPGNVATRNIDSGDLDGDGYPDLVMSRGDNGDRFFVYRNISKTTPGAINFAATPLSIVLPSIGANFRIARRPVIADIDGDGKPDITITNQTDNTIHIYKNESTVDNIAFASTPVAVVATGSTVGISGLDVKDLNNDGFPEIVANPLLGIANMFVFRNISSPGTISMAAATVISSAGGLVNLAVGDFDADGWNDIAATSGSNDVVLVLRNTTTQIGGSITMAAALSVNTNTDAPLGLGLGDLNGDGKLDIAVAHEERTTPRLVALINNTSGGTIAFGTEVISTTSTSRNIKIADLDNDGRPDLAFTHDIVTDTPGDLSVFGNRNCVTPVVDPGDTPVVICTGGTLTLNATLTTGADFAYAWDESGTPVGANSPTYDVTMPGTYKVTVTSDAGSCSVASSTVVVTVDAEANVAPTITGGNACPSADFQLTSSHSGTPTGYQWTGPGGFTSTDANPTISNIQADQAGTYALRVTLGTADCLSDEATTTVTVTNVPQPTVINTAGANFCATTPISISTPNHSGFTYNWNQGGSPLGETNTTLNVAQSGDYSVTITDPNTTCSLESASQTITAVPTPVSSFTTSVTDICVNLPVDFTATSTGQSGFTLNYNYDFGDAANSTATTSNSTFTYTGAGTFSPVLTTGYDELTGCTNTATTNINVQAIPTIVVDVQDESGTSLMDPFEKCPSDAVNLIVPNTLTAIEWTLSGDPNVLGTESTFNTSNEGIYDVTGTDEVGCVINSQVTLSNFAESGLTITSPSTIDQDIITLEEGQTIVMLTVTGGMDYMWDPPEIVNDPTAAMVDVIPFDINTVLTVTGTDINDCTESAIVTIVNPFVIARKSFSPNGDGLGNECWEITNSNTLNNCTVIVFDSRGRRLLETDSPFVEDCVWDGNFEGSPVPEGVYYYAMKCDDNQFNRSGSILLAR